jgi:hypothetical protein
VNVPVGKKNISDFSAGARDTVLDIRASAWQVARLRQAVKPWHLRFSPNCDTPQNDKNDNS